MAFFKFRWPGQNDPQAEKPARRSRSSQSESVEVMRRRARHRLIGAAVLVLVGVVGFPLVFDTQPRPIPVDIPIEIPDRNRVAPLVVPAPVAEAPVAQRAASAAQASSTPPSVAALSSSKADSGVTDGEELVPTPRPAAPRAAPTVAAVSPAASKPETKPESKLPVSPAAPKPETKPESKLPVTPVPEPQPVRSDEAARARALLEGRGSEAPTAKAEDGRFIVQVGAFADADKAREARTRVERAGLKTYMQVVDTKDGKRTRVRVGPFSSRSDAEGAAARIKALDLSASVLAL